MKSLFTCLLFSSLAIAANAQDPQPKPTQPTQPAQPARPEINPTNQQQPGLYLDIKTGKPIDLRYDSKSSAMYDKTTGKPVNYFLNTAGDTVSSRGFYIVNNYLTKNGDDYSIDKTKVNTRENNKLWGTKSNKELDMDKNWKQYTGEEQQKH